MQAIEHVTCIPLWDCLLVPLHGDIPDDHAMGIELRGIETVATLEDALDSMGITRVRRPHDAADERFVEALLRDDSRRPEDRA